MHPVDTHDQAEPASICIPRIHTNKRSHTHPAEYAQPEPRARRSGLDPCHMHPPGIHTRTGTPMPYASQPGYTPAWAPPCHMHPNRDTHTHGPIHIQLDMHGACTPQGIQARSRTYSPGPLLGICTDTDTHPPGPRAYASTWTHVPRAIRIPPRDTHSAGIPAGYQPGAPATRPGSPPHYIPAGT